MLRMITHVAIWRNDTIYALEKPNRHHHVFQIMDEADHENFKQKYRASLTSMTVSSTDAKRTFMLNKWVKLPEIPTLNCIKAMNYFQKTYGNYLRTTPTSENLLLFFTKKYATI